MTLRVRVRPRRAGRPRDRLRRPVAVATRPGIPTAAATDPAEGSTAHGWAAYAAAAWAFLFAAQSLIAATVAMAGSGFGADTFAADFVRLARERDAGFIAVLWLALLAKSLGGAVALQWVRHWGMRAPRRLLRSVTYACGAAILPYGTVNLVQTVRMQTGALVVPPSLGERALAWHLWLWNPYWILGGLLFLAIPRRRGRVHTHGMHLCRPSLPGRVEVAVRVADTGAGDVVQTGKIWVRSS
jgi:hypothetical protein